MKPSQRYLIFWDEEKIKKHFVSRKGAKTPRDPWKKAKLETRNPKQIQMIKKRKILNKFVPDLEFWISYLNVSVCFGPRGCFRYSDFGFSFAGVLWFEGITT